MKNLGVLVNCRKPQAAAVLRRLSDKASALGMEVFVSCGEEAEYLQGATSLPPDRLAERIDVLLALGGDGTVLRAARLLEGSDKPVLGVNLGSLGFLTSVPQESLERAIDMLCEDKCVASQRAVAECRVRRGSTELGCYRGLNDVVVGWGESSRVVTLDVCLDGEPVASYLCDGLIVSTPTGSTGHSLSAGGPILHPESPSLVITVICPHTLSNRPLVVSDTSVIRVGVRNSMKKLLLSVDGQEEMSVLPGDVLEIRRAERGVRFLHLPGYSYFSVLRQKLLWSGSGIAEK